ncbi:hemerythrin domain-containing protein [Cohnella sp. REN36]|uniref:hemerythrin domain-containing protein n=1 Tax=Cohnella sp. REN36 TaxID=2887347 RepID=UPI001D133700|nr:hemerythrin domain-containing protein [Cohnella sp. REN36]MCC3373559.1 hemerythrin domain-containing protein [Cohnella sp. REN36]
MVVHDATDKRLISEDTKLLLLEKAVVRARLDLETLKKELIEVYDKACIVRKDENINRLNQELHELNQTLKHFLRDWCNHNEWEETDLYPYAVWYFGEDPQLFDYMEQDHKMAELYIHAFLQTLNRTTVPVSQKTARRMASYLLQAYAFLKIKFKEEEDILTALEDHSNRFHF